MRKLITAVVGLALSGGAATAMAQSSVSVYGLLDTTLRVQNHANAAGDKVTLIGTPWFSGSRIGFKGNEDLGGGNSVIFRLENEFVVGTGGLDTANVLFNRDAWVGVDSASLGKLTVGRQNTLVRDFAQIYGDAYGSSKLSTEEGGFTGGGRDSSHRRVRCCHS